MTSAPDFHVKGGVSFTSRDHKLGIMMSSFNQQRSKMDGTGAWHLSKPFREVYIIMHYCIMRVLVKISPLVSTPLYTSDVHTLFHLLGHE